jgi:hypothetical protein
LVRRQELARRSGEAAIVQLDPRRIIGFWTVRVTHGPRP